MFSEIYPGPGSDSVITEKFEVICWVEEEHEIRSGKGLPSKICVVSKILNRPCQKYNQAFRS